MPLFRTIAFAVIKLVIIFLIVHSILVEIVSNKVGTETEAGEGEGVSEAATISPGGRFLQSTIWYQTILNPYRNERPHHVTVITLPENEELGDVCQQRRFTAALLLSIARLDPAVIVIDKFYSQLGCADPNANRLLTSALAEIKTPVVIGVNSRTGQDGRLVLATKMDLGDSGKIKYGLVRINSDPRHIPIGWHALNTDSEMLKDRKSSWMPSLSVVAAQQWDPEIVRRLESKGLMERHPYTTLISQAAIPTYAASYLVASLQQPNSALRGKIVVIGDVGTSSLIGGMPAVMLQANYIESLLDSRYVAPVSGRLEFALNLSLAGVLAWVFFSTTGRRAFVFLPLSFLISWLLVYLLITFSGYYMVTWFPVGGLLGLWARHRKTVAEQRNSF